MLPRPTLQLSRHSRPVDLIHRAAHLCETRSCAIRRELAGRRRLCKARRWPRACGWRRRAHLFFLAGSRVSPDRVARVRGRRESSGAGGLRIEQAKVTPAGALRDRFGWRGRQQPCHRGQQSREAPRRENTTAAGPHHRKPSGPLKKNKAGNNAEARTFAARRLSADGSRRRRGCDVEIPLRRVAAPPRVPRG